MICGALLWAKGQIRPNRYMHQNVDALGDASRSLKMENAVYLNPAKNADGGSGTPRQIGASFAHRWRQPCAGPPSFHGWRPSPRCDSSYSWSSHLNKIAFLDQCCKLLFCQGQHVLGGFLAVTWPKQVDYPTVAVPMPPASSVRR